LDAKTAHLEVKFNYFREKAAPVSGKVGMMAYECGFVASGGAVDEFLVVAHVPVTTLCPCSKEISAFGAHNQRGYVTVRIEAKGMLWLEDVIDMIEAAGSAQLYPVLKRPDEKFVTEQAYQNPRFVEDMVREVSWSLTNIRMSAPTKWRSKTTNRSTTTTHTPTSVARNRETDSRIVCTSAAVRS